MAPSGDKQKVDWDIMRGIQFGSVAARASSIDLYRPELSCRQKRDRLAWYRSTAPRGPFPARPAKKSKVGRCARSMRSTSAAGRVVVHGERRRSNSVAAVWFSRVADDIPQKGPQTWPSGVGSRISRPGMWSDVDGSPLSVR